MSYVVRIAPLDKFSYYGHVQLTWLKYLNEGEESHLYLNRIHTKVNKRASLISLDMIIL